jgi:hypothetical protein
MYGAAMPRGDARCDVLEALEFGFVLNLQVHRLELSLEVAEGHDLAGVVRGHGGALEFLSQDLVAHPDAVGVECGREELASSLAWSALSVRN